MSSQKDQMSTLVEPSDGITISLKPMENHIDDEKSDLEHVHELAECTQSQIMELAKRIISNHQKLTQNGDILVRFLSTKKVDGAMLENYKRKQFIEDVVEFGDGNKKLKGVATKILKELQTYFLSEDGEDEVAVDDNATPEQFNSFQYGVYLEYWRPDFKNSVKPKYDDLRDELLNNKWASIGSAQYARLLESARQMLQVNPLKAKYVGPVNKICGVKEGDVITVEHIIASIVYTDLNGGRTSAEFKKHCRRLKDEPLHEIVERNREIAHWCRLMKELCIFYGDPMDEGQVV